MLTDSEFLDNLRDALNHLYDPNRLQHSALASLFGVTEELNTAGALQRILTDAIAALEPEAGVPSHSRAWRIYDLLFCRYVQQMSVEAVADQLGVGMRHLRREQHTALEDLAERLYKQYNLRAKLQETPPAPARTSLNRPTLSDELAWLKNTRLEQPTDLAQALSSVLALVQPLADDRHVQLEAAVPAEGMDLAVHPVALNQILLNLLSLTITWSGGGQVRVVVRPLRREVVIDLLGIRFFSDPPAAPEGDNFTLEMTREMADLCGGRFTFSFDKRECQATLALPAYERLLVLAIDDNADTLKLLQHYTCGTRYRLIGTQDPQEALGWVERMHPQIVVLDVMMPQVDGWKVLASLRQQLVTGYLPVIVCSVVPQEKLAILLGANGFVRKPVTQEAFLSALDQQVALMAPESG